MFLLLKLLLLLLPKDQCCIQIIFANTLKNLMQIDCYKNSILLRDLDKMILIIKRFKKKMKRNGLAFLSLVQELALKPHKKFFSC